ncbi:hypothetical protein [Altericista sp. CCNU0014]|uniref:hypothetical protein n=1 Tax=Altericista sp. CCNU0014 TaxID=3082949 RepID=UPI00384F3DC5
MKLSGKLLRAAFCNLYPLSVPLGLRAPRRTAEKRAAKVRLKVRLAVASGHLNNKPSRSDPDSDGLNPLLGEYGLLGDPHSMFISTSAEIY